MLGESRAKRVSQAVLSFVVAQLYGLLFVPVVTLDGRLVGLVSESKLRRATVENRGAVDVAELAGRREALSPEQPLIDAIVLMDSRQLAVVVDSSESVIGIVSLSDIMRAQASALAAARNGHRGTGGGAP